MTDSSPQSRFQDVADAARDRLARALGDRPKITVQVGHCGQSIGASELAREVAARFGGTATVITAGCDGACFAAPTVIVSSHSGRTRRLERVSPDDLEPIARALNDDLSPSASSGGADFIAAQNRIALDGCGTLDAESIDDYLANDGYSALAKRSSPIQATSYSKSRTPVSGDAEERTFPPD